MNKLYWKYRKAGKKITFKCKAALFNVWTRIEHRKENIDFQQKILWEVIKQIIFNLAVIALILFLERKIIPEDIKIESIDLMPDFLIAIIGVAGVFLGLYCSNIMSMFSEKYANAPKKIARLFENDFITNKCIHSITNYLVFGILVLLCNVAGITTGILMLLVCGVYGIQIIISFGGMSKRTYQFADTYYVANQLYREIAKNIRNAKAGGFLSEDASFQNHYRKQTKELLELLESTNEYSLNQTEYKTASIENFMRSNLSVINLYWFAKREIPYDSYWYADKVVYKKWYSTSDHEIQMALQTGTDIGHKMERDYWWFEDRIFNINEQCFDALVKREPVMAFVKWMNVYEQLCETAVRLGETVYYVKGIRKLQKKGLAIMTNKELELSIDDEMSLAEMMVSVYIHFLIKVREYAQGIQVDEIMSKIIEGENICLKTIYRYCNYADVRNFFQSIKTELKVEGERITPDWYMKQMVAKHVYDEILQIYEEMDKAINEEILKIGNKLLKEKKYAGSMIVFSKMNEVKSKAEIAVTWLENILSEVEKYHFETALIWKKREEQGILWKMETNYKQIPAKWCQCASFFTVQNWKSYDKYPDLLGACYNYLCEFLLESIMKNSYEDFAQNFDKLPGMAFLYQGISREELKEMKETYQQSAVMAVYSNPIIELGEIAGYAYIWGEISGDNRWKDLLHTVFEKRIGLEKELCEQIVNIYEFKKGRRAAIYNRDTIRTGWRQRMEQAFDENGNFQWKRKQFMEILDTENAFLRAIIGHKDYHRLLHCKAYEVFAVMILNNYLPEEKKYKSINQWEDELENEKK